MSPVVYVTGGAEGLGRGICEYFGETSQSFSRRNGFDIGIEEVRQKLVTKSLDCDIFVNLAHNGHFSGQTQLLYDLFASWESKRKSGYIINIGSYSTYSVPPVFKRFAVIKHGLDVASRQCCRKLENSRLPFRITNLRPALLDIEKTRAHPQWKGAAVSSRNIAQIIEALYRSPEDLLIPEVVVSFPLPTGN